MRAVAISLGLVALLASAPSLAWQAPAACTRDVAGEPAAIRALFDRVDRMAVRELHHASVQFYLDDEGFIPIDEFVLRSNFHDGREDMAALQVTGIRPLQFDAGPRREVAYVVATRRQAWWDGPSHYVQHNETWLVHFSGCRIDHVTEAPDLYYLLEDPD